MHFSSGFNKRKSFIESMYLPACIILSYDVTAAQFARSGDVNIPIQQDVGDADLIGNLNTKLISL